LFPKKLSEILIILDPVPGTVPLRVIYFVSGAVVSAISRLASSTDTGSISRIISNFVSSLVLSSVPDILLTCLPNYHSPALATVTTG